MPQHFTRRTALPTSATAFYATSCTIYNQCNVMNAAMKRFCACDPPPAPPHPPPPPAAPGGRDSFKPEACDSACDDDCDESCTDGCDDGCTQDCDQCASDKVQRRRANGCWWPPNYRRRREPYGGVTSVIGE